jgi:hypothetical protein
MCVSCALATCPNKQSYRDRQVPRDVYLRVSKMRQAESVHPITAPDGAMHGGAGAGTIRALAHSPVAAPQHGMCARHGPATTTTACPPLPSATNSPRPCLP